MSLKFFLLNPPVSVTCFIFQILFLLEGTILFMFYVIFGVFVIMLLLAKFSPLPY